jgi:hypothetical protein
MKVDLEAAEASLAQASTELAAGNILGAKNSLANAQKLLKKIFDQLSTSGEAGLM